MITPAPAPKQPEISPLVWAGDPEQCPKWIGYPSRLCLPQSIIWSGAGSVPSIGARVHIYMNSIGPATVRAYFHADGYMGVICEPDTMPEHLRKHGVTLAHFFGRELEPYLPGPAAPAMVPEVVEIEQVADPIGKAQEQYRLCVAREEQDRRYHRSKQREAQQAYPHEPDKQQQHCQDALQMVELATLRTQQAKQALATAEQLYGQSGAEQAGDWIPDYPPQGEELADDNQVGTEYPGHPTDEQRE
jgi:hypothetical protein